MERRSDLTGMPGAGDLFKIKNVRASILHHGGVETGDTAILAFAVLADWVDLAKVGDRGHRRLVSSGISSISEISSLKDY
jgi:hypothetical protein